MLKQRPIVYYCCWPKRDRIRDKSIGWALWDSVEEVMVIALLLDIRAEIKEQIRWENEQV